jgi:hypothetical protein
VKPVWLIESGVYGSEAEPLCAEIRRQGMIAELVPHQALKRGATVTVAGMPLGPEACVIGYGTYPFARQIQLHHPWAPGAWCNLYFRFKCGGGCRDFRAVIRAIENRPLPRSGSPPV